MPRNTPASPGSSPTDEEPSNHRRLPERLPRDRAEQDDVAGMPRATRRRRAHSDPPSYASSEAENEDFEAPRGRSAERSVSDGERPVSATVSPPGLRIHSEGLPEAPGAASGVAQTRNGLRREFPRFGCSMT